MTYTLRGTILFILISASAFISGQDGQSIEVMTDGRSAGQMPVVIQGNVAFVPVSEITGHLGLRFFENKQKKKVVLSLGQRSVILTHRNPFIIVDKKAMQMPSPPLEMDGHMWIPLTYFIHATQDFFTQKLVFDPGSMVLNIQSAACNITDVQIESMKNGCLIHIKTGRTFGLQDIGLAVHQRWLNITIYGGSLDSTRLASEVRNGIIDKIVPKAFKNSAQIAFLCNQTILHKEVEVNSDEILIQLRTPVVSAESPAHNGASDRSRWLIDTIILDPGHGGRDPGAIGKSGTRESHINLKIALKLKAYMHSIMPDVKVLMTRDDDTFIGLRERTQFAIENRGKLFISIHADANTSSGVRGFSSYILGRSGSKIALEAAQKENSVIDLEDDPSAYQEFEGVAFIMNAIATNVYMKESENLARMVNETMKLRTGIPDRGVHQSRLYVLINYAMPTILIETAFLSNKYEERLLKTNSFQQKVAEAIGESIKQFKAVYEKGIG
ncbi:N-acetylmuramoyl-L-alanine amidase [bacterium]|nr:N-acetylmuramoyl-L-alanine amidase [bacterium]